MGIVVPFDLAAFRVRYPEFAYLSDALLTAYFDEATMFCRNDGGGPIRVAAVQSRLLNMMTAHVAALNAPTDPAVSGGVSQPSSPIVGRINSATEGSVSVGSENNYPPGTVQWYQQTKYGSAFYAATAPYRTMRYLPGPGAYKTYGVYQPVVGRAGFWQW